jgi:hypothetical protein
MAARSSSLAALLSLSALACGGEGVARGDAAGEAAGRCEGGEPLIFLVRTLAFARVDEAGVSSGFDLDGAVSDGSDAQGCGVTDFVSPEGAAGVDNGWAGVQPALDLTEAVAIESLVQSSIEAGNLLILAEITGIDDLEDDDCVNLRILRASGTPMLGTDGLILSGQTFDVEEGIPAVTVAGARIEGGAVLAGPLDLAIPITVFDVSLDFLFTRGGFRLDLEDREHGSGVMGGGTSTADLVTVAEANDAEGLLGGIMKSLLDQNADLWPDDQGVCQDISVNFELDAVSAFLYDSAAARAPRR